MLQIRLSPFSYSIVRPSPFYAGSLFAQLWTEVSEEKGDWRKSTRLLDDFYTSVLRMD